MKGRLWKQWLGTALALCLILAFGQTSHAAKLHGKSLKIGHLACLSGICAEWGAAAKIGMTIALEEIHASGGIGGLPVEVIEYDDEGKGAPAIPLLERLVNQDKVLAINGPCQSSTFEVLARKLDRLQIVIVSYCSSAPGLSALSPWAFRNTLTSDKQLEPTVRRWQRAYNIKTAVILYNDEDRVSTAEGRDILTKLFEKNGIKLLEMFTFQSKTVDFAPYITKIKALNPDGIGLGSCYEAGAKIAIEARRQGVKAPLVGGACNSTSGLIEIGGPAVEGYYGSTAAWIDSPDPKVVKFVREFQKRSTGGKKPVYGGLRSYDNAYLFKKIIEEGGVTNNPDDLEKDRERIKNGWAKVKDFPGISGLTTMDAVGDGIGEVKTLVVKGGVFIEGKD